MGFFDSIGKGLKKIAGVAAPFIPGVGGVVAGLLGGAGGDGGSKATGQADAALGQQQQFAQQQMRQYQQYGNPLMQALMGQAGIGPDGRQADPNYNPARGLANELFGDTAINARANQQFDPSQLTGGNAAYQQSIDAQYDNAASEAQAKSLQRGMLPGGDGGLASDRGALLRAQASDNANFRRTSLADLMNQKRAYTLGEQGKRTALLTGGMDAKNQMLTNGLNLVSNSAQGAMGTMGGLGGFYQNRADNGAAQQAALYGAIGQSGLKLPEINLNKIVGGLFGKKRKQSTSLGTTNAQYSTPLGGSAAA